MRVFQHQSSHFRFPQMVERMVSLLVAAEAELRGPSIQKVVGTCEQGQRWLVQWQGERRTRATPVEQVQCILREQQRWGHPSPLYTIRHRGPRVRRGGQWMHYVTFEGFGDHEGEWLPG